MPLHGGTCSSTCAWVWGFGPEAIPAPRNAHRCLEEPAVPAVSPRELTALPLAPALPEAWITSWKI